MEASSTLAPKFGSAPLPQKRPRWPWKGPFVPRDGVYRTAAGSRHAGTATAKERAQLPLRLPTDIPPAMPVRTLRSLPEAEQPPLTSRRYSDILSSCSFLFLSKTKQKNLGKKEEGGCLGVFSGWFLA